MKIENFLSHRLLKKGGRTRLLSSLTAVAFLGIIISVMAFVVVLSVVKGFSEDLQAKVLGFSSHLSVQFKPGTSPELIESWQQRWENSPEVESFYAYLEGEAIVRTLDDQMLGMRLRGVKPGQPPQGKTLDFEFVEGQGWKNLSAQESELPGILLGSELAANLKIIPEFGERVELLFPLGEVGPTGELEPNQRSFRVVGTFRSGYFDYDNKYAFVPYDEAEFLLGDQAQETWALFLKDPFQKKEALTALLPPQEIALTRNWQEQHERLFSALQLDRLGMGFVLGLMLLLSSFNILSLLMLVVYERKAQLAILRALGMSQKQVAASVYRIGLRLGLIGGVIGMALGVGIAYFLSRADLPLPSTYYLEALPVKIQPWVLLVAVAVAVLVSWLATHFPARQANRFSVVEALRYE